MAISPLSVQSLLLRPAIIGKAELGSATGFIVLRQERAYLITNWHVVSGRDPYTGQPLASHGGTPDCLNVAYLLPPTASGLSWELRQEPLLDDSGAPRWLEHPTFGRRVDVAALPLTKADGAQIMPYTLGPPPSSAAIRAMVADFVNIVGFPFGVTAAGAIAIWTKGAIASEPEIDFDMRPCFLIDARTRQGQSGSPVIAYSPGGPTVMEDGSLAILTGTAVNLLGIYSGRINKESDLGMVWKPRAIQDIVENGKPGNDRLVP